MFSRIFSCKCSSTITTPPTLCYPWIGAPAKESGGVKGHDIAAPIQMAKANKSNKIFFACLKKYFDHYSSILNKYGIAVIAIEDDINQKFQDPFSQDAATKVKYAMDKILVTGRNEVRDRVTIKVLYGFFWLATRGGYCLDTNVFPNRDSVSLPRYDVVHIPAYVIPPEQRTHCDCWMMFSPPENTERAKLTFEMYFQLFQEAESIFERNVEKGIDPYTEDYHEALGKAIMIAAFEVKGKLQFWLFERNKFHFANAVKELGLVKYYFNTHHLKRRQDYNAIKLFHKKFNEALPDQMGEFSTEIKNHIFEYFYEDDVKSHGMDSKTKSEHPPIFLAVVTDNPVLLTMCLDAGEDINQVVSNAEIKNDTLLHKAVAFKSKNCLKIFIILFSIRNMMHA